MKKYVLISLLLLFALLRAGTVVVAQQVMVNMGPLDGVEITPDNLFDFQVLSQLDRGTNALIEGSIRFRNSDMRISYKFEYNVQPGVNMFRGGVVNPPLQYSSSALKELFELYKKLPQGIYEYCVSVKQDYHVSEVSPGDPVSDCIYHKSQDIFLINLVDPENNAEIYEYNPMLSWTVNYPFASALTYRLRVAELKSGQNPVTAITRNNPVYDERNLSQMSVIYPPYARPLEKLQPYVWTVDAYYRGILLGGAEPWVFTIIEDSLYIAVDQGQSYIDIRKGTPAYAVYAPGKLKLKYYLDDYKTDSLSLELLDKNEKSVKLGKVKALRAEYGDNRFIIDFKEDRPLKHRQRYTLLLTSSRSGKVYRLIFQYVNPELVK